MRVLGVDLGTKRIGLAVGESEFNIATPRPALRASGTLARDAEAIAHIAKAEEVERIIVGQPLNEEDSRMARVCAMLGSELEKLGWSVALVDESFSSVQAESLLNQSELKGSQRRRLRDGAAAAIILDRYFDEQTRA